MSKSVLKEETILFTSPQKDAHKLIGTLWSSLQSSINGTMPGNAEAVILCHGLMSDKESPLLKSIAYHLTTQLGLSTFRFDFSGNGESDGIWDYGSYNEEAAELEQAITMLQDTHGLSTIAIIGHSRGATVVCLHTANPYYTKVPLVVSLSGRYDMTNKPDRFTEYEKHELETIGYCDWILPTTRDDGIKRRYRWKKDSIDNIMSMDTKKMTEECARSGCKLMFIGAKDDSAVPINDLHSFRRVYNNTTTTTSSNNNCIVVEVPHGGHSFSNIEDVLNPILDECRKIAQRITTKEGTNNNNNNNNNNSNNNSCL